ncbi:uncharacterized protein [Physcomitrium patens]|uniref:Uncharacterized protein n=1 Tax=Physcomitrium patens TaxID=3218 RepID=A0A2K1J1L5_PHYPA|nr:flocculation protein FLO11-like [Physcomitrium patens]XP_024402454.1 flocculation protein FLO11-like [Physcomitrium patens]XP_024402455.1 flocculation protein FLO11-like [Physcomitrium patens]XP_024402456.1 flocculation protein FLO11-like [Physcomitrium patens]PNR35420.1 hypothetical protein PHYPA_023320 [Physcomitrium patens]|eukprot:XP_024402453.1 flocculation protein FLO11-like [Physcomitrella patens]
MGKGGGKCASRAHSASSTRTSRLPAKKNRKPPVKSPTQASKSSSSKDKVIDPDPSTLVPLISKKESQPAAVEKINDDDDIDTNVTFDQEELDYPASEHERRLTGASSSEMPSVYNTANASPARSFSSGARSPDTVYLSGSEDIPQYIASPVHPVGMPLAIKHSKAGANSPESVVSSQRRIHNDEDQFIARWAPASSSSSTGPSGGVLRKRHSVAASSTAPLEVRSLTTSSSFPTPGGRIEGKPVPNIDSVNKTIDEVNLFGESESRKKDGPLVVEGHIANKEEPKPYDSQGAEALKESLDDNWEMVPAQHQSKGLGREWIAVPTPSITDTKLHAPSSQESKEVESPEQVNERGIGKSREEPLEVFSSIQPVISIADSVSKAAEGPETPVQKENIMKSVASDQSDEIETRSLNGEGGDYVFLGATGSPKTEQSSQDPDLDTDVPESTIALNKLASSSKGDDSPVPNATLQNNEAEDIPIVAHGLREETPTIYDRNEEDREAKPLSKSVKEDEETPEVAEKGLASPAPVPEEKDAPSFELDTTPLEKTAAPKHSEYDPAELVEEAGIAAPALSEDAHVDQPDVEQVHDSKVSGEVEASTSEPVIETESGSAAPAEGVSSVEEAVHESITTPVAENLAAEVGEQDGIGVEFPANDNPDADSWRIFKQEIENDTSQASEGPEANVAEEAKVEELAAAADAEVETTASAGKRELLGGPGAFQVDSASVEVEVAPARVEESAVTEVEKPTSATEGNNAEKASALVEEEVKQEATASSATASPLDANAAETALELQSRESELPVAGSEPLSETVSEIQAVPDRDADSPVSEDQAAAIGDGTLEVQHDDAPMDVVESAPLGNDASTPALDTAQAEEPVASTSSTSATADGVPEVQSREFEIPGAGSEPIPEASLGVEGANEVDVDSPVSAEQDAPAGDDTPVALEQAVPSSLDSPTPGLESAKDGGDVVSLSKDEEVDASPVQVVEDSSVVDASAEPSPTAAEAVADEVAGAQAEVPVIVDASDAAVTPDTNAVDTAEEQSRKVELPVAISEPVSQSASEAAPEVVGLTDVEGASSPVKQVDSPKVAEVAPGEDASAGIAGGLKDVE